MTMPIGNFLISQSASNDNARINVVVPTNVFPILSFPAFQSMALTFCLSNFDVRENHNLEIYLKDDERERKIFNSNISANGDIPEKLPDNFIPSVSGVITLGKVQIDHKGNFKLVVKFDGKELDKIDLIFTKTEPEK